MRQSIIRMAAMLLVLCLTLAFAAAEDMEITLEDTGVIFEEVSYDDVAWNFPVDLMDLDPAMIRLANKEVLLDSDFVPSPLVSIPSRKTDKDGNNTNGGVNKASSSTMQLQEECARALVKLMEAALADGQKLYLKSAYRSYKTQNTMYYNRLEKNGGKDDGWVSKPGASDHQTGLGCDVVPRNWTDRGMNSDMAREEECQWMAAHCQEYGFIIRYPADKEDITEINYEPWHLRYVGIPVATYIMENGLCLEEFHEQLQEAIDQFLADGGNPRLVEGLIQTSAQ
ncbi:MAG: D-alanyl-D-alanine carboxypeptidase family protein [Aristaeellaceae bacterium]